MKQALLLPFFLLTACSAFAQQLTLSGKIKDARNEAVPGVYLMLLKDTGLQKTVLTDVDGKYIFEDMTAGSYTLKASAVGFAAYTSPPLVLQTPTTLPDIVLQEQKRRAGRSDHPGAETIYRSKGRQNCRQCGK